jgi:uncharacterized protein (DUF427 family)
MPGKSAGLGKQRRPEETNVNARTHGRIRIEDGAKRIRTMLGGVFVADSASVKLVWEKPYYPTYYFPVADVRADCLVATGEHDRSPSRGAAGLYTVTAGGAEAPSAARWYTSGTIEELNDYVTFDWGSMGAWFEEDEEVFVHARDPYTRVDILQSSRHVEVVIEGEKIADCRQPRLLFETGLPTRFYLPKTDVRMDLLIESALHTACPYKGEASYYHVAVGAETFDDYVWWYPSPVAESQKIAGYVSFYNEKVDIYLDGELQDRPKTPFS